MKKGKEGYKNRRLKNFESILEINILWLLSLAPLPSPAHSNPISYQTQISTKICNISCQYNKHDNIHKNFVNLPWNEELYLCRSYRNLQSTILYNRIAGSVSVYLSVFPSQRILLTRWADMVLLYRVASHRIKK